MKTFGLIVHSIWVCSVFCLIRLFCIDSIKIWIWFTPYYSPSVITNPNVYGDMVHKEFVLCLFCCGILNSKILGENKLNSSWFDDVVSLARSIQPQYSYSLSNIKSLLTYLHSLVSPFNVLQPPILRSEVGHFVSRKLVTTLQV